MESLWIPLPGWALPVGYVLLSIALVGTLIRLIIGPSPYERIVAADVVAAVVMCFAGLFALETGDRFLFDIALAIAVIAFLGAVAFARHLERLAFDPVESDEKEER